MYTFCIQKSNIFDQANQSVEKDIFITGQIIIRLVSKILTPAELYSDFSATGLFERIEEVTPIKLAPRASSTDKDVKVTKRIGSITIRGTSSFDTFSLGVQ